MEEIEKEAERILEDVEHSMKSQYIEYEWWSKVHQSLGLISILVSVLVGISLDNKVFALISITLLGSLTSVITFVDPLNKALLHRASADRYNELNNEIRIFKNIELRKLDENNAAEKLKNLVSKKHVLNHNSPVFSDEAYKKAKQRIKKGQTKHSIDGKRKN